MHRWWGGKEDSDRQSADRKQRAARRYLASNPQHLSPATDSLDNSLYEDADSSLLNVDGTADEMTDAAARAAAARTAELAKPFDEQDFDDDGDAWKKSLSLKFDRNDVLFWFSETEVVMTNHGINRQWSKRNALMGKDILPDDVIEEIKPLLRLTKQEAGNNIYQTIKKELISIFGPKKETAFEKAASRRLTSRPSALGKLLINDICPDAKPLVSCHCERAVYYYFMQQMPQVIKTQLADKDFNANTYKNIFKLADEVFAANKLGATSGATVVAAVSVTSPAAPQELDTTQPALQYPVEATSFRGQPRGRGRGPRGNRGRGGNRGGQTAQPTTTAQTKPVTTNATLPPNLCSMHKKYQKNAMHCRDPFVCEWAKFIIPRPQ